MKTKVIVIGAGIGGLAISALLAKEGFDVKIVEKNSVAGGKMNLHKANGYRFDTGPSLLTMPGVIDTLFEKCGKKRPDFLKFEPVSPLCRYFYPDGKIFDNFRNHEKNNQSLNSIAPDEIENYKKFLNYSSGLFEKTADAFLFNPLYDTSDFDELKLKDFLGIDAFTTVSKRVDKAFQSQHLRNFFKRFTTYNGSSPYQAPATLNVIPHVEISMGAYYVKGGIYRIAEAYEKLAKSLGVEIMYSSTVEKITIENKKVSGVQLENGTVLTSGLVVANSDASDTVLNLLPAQSVSSATRYRHQKIEPSCSGFVLLLGISKTFEKLRHHNIFFSDNYRHEFRQIFDEKKLPDDPTVYIANTSYTDKTHAPEGHSNLFILVNAPYVGQEQNWQQLAGQYPGTIISKLEANGLHDLHKHIEYSHVITPLDFLEKYRSNKGSIYGTSSNSVLSAFLRPRNKFRKIGGLYLAGGSTHPGGGIPLVTLSALHAFELIKRYESKQIR